MRELEGDPLVMRFTPSRREIPESRSLQRLQNVVEKEMEWGPLGVWAAELESGDFVGWFMLLRTELEHPELGFMLVRRHWGTGLATELAGALLAHALSTLGLGAVCAATDEENVASIRVLEKLGFVYARTFSKPDPVLGGESGLRVYVKRA